MSQSVKSTPSSEIGRDWPLSARILRRLSRRPDADDYAGGSQIHLGERALDFIVQTIPGFMEMIQGRTVLDYGCGFGHQVLAMKAAGAKSVTGYDPYPKFVPDRPSGVEFTAELPTRKFDIVLNSSSFEHFADPEAEFLRMRALAGQRLIITWAEPFFSHNGSHLGFFTQVPWANLLFPERSVFLVRSLYRDDGAQRYEESGLGGALNRMTVARWERILSQYKGDMRVEFQRNYATRNLPLVSHIPIFRELLTSSCACILAAKPQPRAMAAAGGR